jgi:putative Mn2+ efflux pump MntP
MWLTRIALTLPLCLDSFLIAAAVGLTRPPMRTRLRLAILLAAFEAGMPLVGLGIGNVLAAGLGNIAQYFAIALLLGVGGYAALTTKEEDDAAEKLAGVHGLTAFALAFSISLDGLAIGFTYGHLKLSVLGVTVLIAVQAFVLIQIGFIVGGRLPARIRAYGEKLANWVLVVIGLVLLAGKLFHW